MSDGDRKVVIEVIGEELAEAMDALAAAVVGESCALERIAALEAERDELLTAWQRRINEIYAAAGVPDPSTPLIHHLDGMHQYIAALEEHERQTHERLGAILGTDTSLEDGARRQAERIEALEAEVAQMRRAVSMERGLGTERINQLEARWAALREQVDMTAPTIDRARLLTVMDRLERETEAPTTCTPSNSYEPRPDWCGACPKAPCAKLEKYVAEMAREAAMPDDLQRLAEEIEALPPAEQLRLAANLLEQRKLPEVRLAHTIVARVSHKLGAALLYERMRREKEAPR